MMENCCANHPLRIGQVERNGEQLCWECYLGREVFVERFGENFYSEETDK